MVLGGCNLSLDLFFGRFATLFDQFRFSSGDFENGSTRILPAYQLDDLFLSWKMIYYLLSLSDQ